MTGSWGTELWDGYDPVTRHIKSGLVFVDENVSAFVKERAVIESEYANKLRRLVRKFTPKGMVLNTGLERGENKKSGKEKKNGTLKKSRRHDTISGPESIGIVRPTKDDEYSYMNAYKTMLQEVGFIAGQHELLSDSFTKENSKGVSTRVKELKEKLRRNGDTFAKRNSDLRTSFAAMAKAKDKFAKSFNEQQIATEAHDRASREGSTSKNELKKLDMQKQIKTQNCDQMKALYADQMLKANAAQSRFYQKELPEVLNELQSLEQSRIELFRTCVKSMVGKSREVTVIIERCHDSIDDAFANVDPPADTNLVVEKFKTGDVPPTDFRFEDMRDPKSMLQQDTLSEHNAPTKLNLYPVKRDLEKQIAATTEELAKAEREADGLAKMMNTCQSHPKYGKADSFREELKVANHRVQEIERVLQGLKQEHSEVDAKLAQLKHRGGGGGGDLSAPATPGPRPASGDVIQRHNQARISSSPSIKSSLSVGSSSGASSQSGGGVVSPYQAGIGGGGGGGSYAQDVSARLSAGGGGNNSTYSSMPSHHSPSVTDVTNSQSSYQPSSYHPHQSSPPHAGDPPVTSRPPSQGWMTSSPAASETDSNDTGVSSSPSGGGGGPFKRCEALYDYTEGLEANNIPMFGGDQFYVIEEDSEGWTRVRRLMPTASGLDEGYVPSAYLKLH